eukprot:10217_1
MVSPELSSTEKRSLALHLRIWILMVMGKYPERITRGALIFLMQIETASSLSWSSAPFAQHHFPFLTLMVMASSRGQNMKPALIFLTTRMASSTNLSFVSCSPLTYSRRRPKYK